MDIIDYVNIDLADSTVLTGYNDSGKSTINKIIYSLYKGINYEKENLKKDIIGYIFFR